MAAPTGRRRRTSLVKLRGKLYYEDFTVRGCPRFRKCLGTGDRDTAERLAAETKAAALAGQAARGKAAGEKPDIKLNEAVVRYWTDVAQYWRTARQAKIHNRTLIEHLGGETLLAELDFGRLAAFVAERRAGLENASVNRELGHLRGIVNACGAWGYRVPERIAWKSARGPSLFLDEPENRQTILPVGLEEAFFAALRPDFRAVSRFALLTGVRRENALNLRWSEIDWDAGTITLRTKSKKPERKLHVLPLTGALKALLALERGRHPEFVFTYLCEHPDASHQKGQRYPLAKDGNNFRRAWIRAREAVGLPELRFHDLRHTAGTRMAAIRPLGRVQRLLGHADIRTTARYTLTTIDDLAEAMEAVAATGLTQNLTQAGGNIPKKTGTSDA